jgi:hypothetical protein
VVGETPLCYRVKPVATKAVLWPKQYCHIDFDFYPAGYQSSSTEPLETIETVAKLSAFVPSLILADRKLDAQIEAGRDDWDKVFCYDIAQVAGAWLAANPKTTVEQFTAHLEGLIA